MVDEIRNKFTGQYGQLSQLGREYGVTFHAIRLIVLGKRWKVVHNIRQ